MIKCRTTSAMYEPLDLQRARKGSDEDDRNDEKEGK
jgi:hypothetical protein